MLIALIIIGFVEFILICFLHETRESLIEQGKVQIEINKEQINVNKNLTRSISNILDRIRDEH